MGQLLQGVAVISRYRLADMYVEAAVMPGHEQINVPLGDGTLIQQHLQDLVPEELFQCVEIVIRSDVEDAMLVKGAIGYYDVAVRVETEEVAEGLDGAGAAGHGVVCACHVLSQRLPGGAA